MTNAELIEKLQKLPQDAEVVLVDKFHEYGNFSPITAHSEKEENTVVIYFE